MKFNFFHIIVILFLNYSFGQQSEDFRKIDSLKRFVLSAKELDSSSVARNQYIIAEYYRKSTPLTDSAFYYYHQAEKIFKKLNSKYELALTLYGIAVIQKNEKDFIGSEVTSIEALSLLESFSETDDIITIKSFIYNNLGIVFKELEQYDESVKYHINALELKRKLKGDNRKTIDKKQSIPIKMLKNSIWL